jgi:hypothetical protein
MATDTDEKFYARADAHIQLANNNLADTAPGKVSASMMFAASRFNAWVSAKDFTSGAEMETRREEIIEYFVSQYRAMLNDNVNNYIEHFDAFMNPKGNS